MKPTYPLSEPSAATLAFERFCRFSKPIVLGLLFALSSSLVPAQSSSDPAWPFDRPSLSSLRSSSRKVWAHYFPQFPLAFSNVHALTPDYYYKHYMTPFGEKQKHYAYGAYLRDRPIWRAPYTPGSADATNFELKNAEYEVDIARRLGIDGFTLDVLEFSDTSTTSPDNWRRALTLMQAAVNVDTGFKIVIMPDMTVSAFNPTKPNARSNFMKAVRKLSQTPSASTSPAYRIGGRLVIAPFQAHKLSAADWKSYLDEYNATYGEDVIFLPTFQDWENPAKVDLDAFLSTTLANGRPLLYGVHDWGHNDAGPYNATGATGTGNASSKWVNFSKNVHNKRSDLIAMAPVRPQDFRPHEQARHWEPNNSYNFRKMWDNAIRPGADNTYKANWVQLITWNDYSEHAHIAPSGGTQYGYYDLAAYYTTWFKTGTAPTITRDTIYYFHRKQHSSAAWATAYQGFTPKFEGNTAISDHIELVAFLRNISGNNNCVLEINLNNGTPPTTQNVTVTQSGGQLAFLRVPVPSGSTDRCNPSFRLLRGGTVVQSVRSAFDISNQITWTDMLYRAGSSRRSPVEGVAYARVNFQLADTSADTGSDVWNEATWWNDTGGAYAARFGLTNFKYGWVDTSGNAVNNPQLRDRDQPIPAIAPDERYDTLAKTRISGAHRDWRITVPAGVWKLRIVSGDSAPPATNTPMRVSVSIPSGYGNPVKIPGTDPVQYALSAIPAQTVTYVSGNISSTTNRWIEVDKPIIVPFESNVYSDSPTLREITVTAAPGYSIDYNAINFIEITPW